MNDQLQAQVTTILKQFSDGISTVGDVAMKELPDIAQQYVTYGFVKGIIGVTVSGAFLIAMIYTVIWGLKELRKTGNDGYLALIIFPTMIAFFTAILMSLSVENLILNITAPKLWLLLEIKNLIS